MSVIILKCLGFIFMILLGSFARRIGMITKEDGKKFSKIALTFTLPCSLILGFNGVNFSFWMIVCFICGIALPTAVSLSAKYLISRGASPHETANNMICCCGYNGGSFAIPFCQSFFPASAIGYLIMFDMGNSIMAFGGAGALGGSALETNGHISVKKLLDKLFSSVPFCVYVVLVVLSVFGIRLPDVFLDFIIPIAQANIFLMMFTVGSQLELNVDRAMIEEVWKIFAVRLGWCGLVGILIHMLPTDILMKQVLTIISFAPLCTPSVIWAQELECDTRIPAMVCSLGIIVSIVVCMGVLFIFL